MLSTLLTGISFGLSGAAPIGPINIEIARRSIHCGFFHGFLLGCGAVTVDMAYVTLASLGVKPIADRPMVLIPLAVLGAAFLAWLGISALRSARRHYRDGISELPPDTASRNYVTGVLLTSINPLTLIFWFLSTTVAGMLQQNRGNLHLLALGVGLGAISWVIFFASLMSLAGKAKKRVAILFADVAGGLTLLIFAALTIWTVVKRPL